MAVIVGEFQKNTSRDYYPKKNDNCRVEVGNHEENQSTYSMSVLHLFLLSENIRKCSFRWVLRVRIHEKAVVGIRIEYKYTDLTNLTKLTKNCRYVFFMSLL